MFGEHDVFKLRVALPDGSIPIGAIGVVLMVHDGPTRAYEVEFPDGKGGNLGKSVTYAVPEEVMEPLA